MVSWRERYYTSDSDNIRGLEGLNFMGDKRLKALLETLKRCFQKPLLSRLWTGGSHHVYDDLASRGSKEIVIATTPLQKKFLNPKAALREIFPHVDFDVKSIPEGELETKKDELRKLIESK